MILPIACPTMSELQRMIGVHSLERSAQEDTLLVLFNTAISNLVSGNFDFCTRYHAKSTGWVGSIPK